MTKKRVLEIISYAAENDLDIAFGKHISGLGFYCHIWNSHSVYAPICEGCGSHDGDFRHAGHGERLAEAMEEMLEIYNCRKSETSYSPDQFDCY